MPYPGGNPQQGCRMKSTLKLQPWCCWEINAQLQHCFICLWGPAFFRSSNFIWLSSTYWRKTKNTPIITLFFFKQEVLWLSKLNIYRCCRAEYVKWLLCFYGGRHQCLPLSESDSNEWLEFRGRMLNLNSLGLFPSYSAENTIMEQLPSLFPSLPLLNLSQGKCETDWAQDCQDLSRGILLFCTPGVGR